MATNGQGGWLISKGFHRGLLAVIVTATLMSAGVGGAVQTVVLEDFESGGTAGATQATPTNSSSTDSVSYTHLTLPTNREV